MRKLKRALVIGLGNTLNGDDGFGKLVVERIRHAHPVALDDWDLADAHTDLLAHIDSFQNYEIVLLVDALLDPHSVLAPAGEVVSLDEDGLTSLADSSPGSHTLSPLLAIRLYRRLYGEGPPHFSVVLLCTDRIQVGRTTYLSDATVDMGYQLILKLLVQREAASPSD